MQVTALRCRVISVDQYGGPRMAAQQGPTTCQQIRRGETSDATMMNMFRHLIDDHGINEDDAGYYELQWRNQAKQRIAGRIVLTSVMADLGIEASEDQVKKMVRALEKAGAPMRVHSRALNVYP